MRNYIFFLFSFVFIFTESCSCNQNKKNVKPMRITTQVVDSTKKFISLVEGIKEEGKCMKYETLIPFLPDSIRSEISKNEVLFAEFKVKVSNRVILKINSNGKTDGKIVLCCFSLTGNLIDYLIIQRYDKNVGLNKEIIVTKRKDGFEFEIITTENPNPNVMPLFTDDKDYNKEKWKLNQSGKFEITL